MVTEKSARQSKQQQQQQQQRDKPSSTLVLRLQGYRLGLAKSPDSHHVPVVIRDKVSR